MSNVTPTVKDEYRESFEEWSINAVFRMTVYLILLIFGLLNVLALNALYAGEILTEGQDAVQFLTMVLFALISAMFLMDFSRGIVYWLISEYGKHRAFLVPAIALPAYFAYNLTDSAGLPPEYATAYSNLVLALGLMIAVTIVQAAIYPSDIKWVRSKITRGGPT